MNESPDHQYETSSLNDLSETLTRSLRDRGIDKETLVRDLKEKGLENPDVSLEYAKFCDAIQDIVVSREATPAAKVCLELIRSGVQLEGGYEDDALQSLYDALTIAKNEEPEEPYLEEWILSRRDQSFKSVGPL